MSRGYWLSIFVIVEWLVCSPLLYAQNQPSPTLKSQPVAPSHQGKDDQGNAKASAEKQPQAEPIVPALKQIESAIRDVISESDEANDQRQHDREEADLKAQQDMAIWAERMFWATFAAVVVSLLGLALIGRTLHHTRRAADYAKDMVDEAKATTNATLKIINQEQTNAQRQLRAYVGVETISLCNGINPSLTIDPIASPPGTATTNLLRIMCKNFGQTPANNVMVFGYWITIQHGIRLAPEYFKTLPPDFVDINAKRTSVSRFILENGKSHQVDISIWDPSPWVMTMNSGANLYVFGHIYYRDAFSISWRTRFCYQWQSQSHGEKFIPYEHYNDEDQEPPPSLE